MERIAAILGPASSLPIWIQFLRLCAAAHNKKNWLFFGGAEAGQRSAILYTIVECCRLRDIDPMAYLRDVLTRLPSMTNWQIKDVTPKAWAQARSDSRQPLAA